MKTTLLLLIISFSAMAQSNESNYDQKFARADIAFNELFESINNKKVIKVNSDSMKINVHDAELVTINLLLEYDKECYDDSTYVEYYQHHSPLTNNDGTGTLAIYITPTLVKVWHHKKPTFEGFLEWLKSRQ